MVQERPLFSRISLEVTHYQRMLTVDTFINLSFPTDRLDDIVPTYGFSRADLRVSGYDLSLYDLGGGDSIRDIWRKYYAEVTLENVTKKPPPKLMTFSFLRLMDSSLLLTPQTIIVLWRQGLSLPR